MDFLLRKFANTNKVLHPHLKNVQDKLSINILNVIEYYRNKEHMVINNHLIMRLCKLLQEQNFNIDNEYSFPLECNGFISDISSAFGFNTTFKQGTIQNCFYGRDLIHLKEIRKIPKVENGLNLEPIQVKRHDIDWFDYELIDANKYNRKEISVIEIDIAELYLMLKTYSESNIQHKSLANFVACYVLPNMLVSHIEMVWYNKFYKHAIGLPYVKEEKFRYKALANSDWKMIEILGYYNDYFKNNSRITIPDIINNLPSAFGTETFYEYDIDHWINSKPFLIYLLLSRGSFLAYLIDLTIDKEDSNKSINRSYLTDLVNTLRTSIGSRIFSSINTLDSDEEYFNVELITPLNKNGFKLNYF